MGGGKRRAVAILLLISSHKQSKVPPFTDPTQPALCPSLPAPLPPQRLHPIALKMVASDLKVQL